MAKEDHHARVTALSLAHAAALGKLLRAHGAVGHADNLDAALQEIVRIVSAQLGPRTLEEAMRWLAEQSAEAPEPGPAGSLH